MKLTQRIRNISEQVGTTFGSGLRTSFASLRRSFWPLSTVGRIVVNMDNARSLYRNSNTKINLAGGFAKRIIDAVPEFMGMPHCSTGDQVIDEQVNQYIRDFWSAEIQQFIKDACRDSRTVVRFRKHPVTNPLVGTDERAAGFLEIIPPERCDIFYGTQDATVMERALVKHEIEMVDEEFDIASGREPKTSVHQITEEITLDSYRYYDHTTHQELTDWEQSNTWGFVPLVEIFNEYESYLEGGQSDLEPVYAFLSAFHDVMVQTLTAHKYHSIPKAVFSINDVQNFLVNNFPESFQLDENGQALPGTFNGTVEWKGSEILFVQPDENVGFLEAKSVIGDSQTLLAFLLDCIVIASETPKWVIMLDVGAADRSETLTFLKRIERKRAMYAPYIQQIVKMALVSNKQEPVRVQLEWDEIDPNQIVTLAQAMQQATMSVELLAERQLISDRTAREYMRRFIPGMKPPDEEATDAEKNKQLTQTVDPNSPTDPRAIVPSNGNVQ